MAGRYAAAVLLIVCAARLQAAPLPTEMSLDGTWRLKDQLPGRGVAREMFRDAYWKNVEPDSILEAPVPGIVQTAQLLAGKILDPYLSDDAASARAAEGKEWWYYRTFTVPSDWKGRRVVLIFEGINYYAEAWLNGERIGDMLGMFRRFEFDASSLVRFGASNSLSVRVLAAKRKSDDRAGIAVPDRKTAVTCQMSYDWDFAPRILPIGIWRHVRLRATGPCALSDLRIAPHIESRRAASLDISFQVTNHDESDARVSVTGDIEGVGFQAPWQAFEKTVEVKAGSVSPVTAQAQIIEPKLWWPNGMGDHPLYRLTLTASLGDDGSDRVAQTFGVREIKVIPNEDARAVASPTGVNITLLKPLEKPDKKREWTFTVNGRRLFVKGANWVPPDSLFRLSRQRYERYVRLAAEAGFNMLRVWGGGLTEWDDFYDLCDRYGLLVWQEFPLCVADYPSLPRDVFEASARETVRRIRNHPCLALWCGGNEFDPNKKENKDLVEGLSAIIAELDPETRLHRASPHEGDDHYWGVWHGKQPMTAYRRDFAFRAEAGAQAMPSVDSLRRFIPLDLLWPYNSIYDKHKAQSANLHVYHDEYGKSSSIEEYVRRSQLAQATIDRYNLEFCRSRQYGVSGCLVWQLDEPWPAVSWSIVDWYGTPKAAYYFLKRACSNIAIVADYNTYFWRVGDQAWADLWIVNDAPYDLRGARVVAEARDVNWKVLHSQEFKVDADADTSTLAGRLAFDVPDALSKQAFFLRLVLLDRAGEVAATNLYWMGVREQVPSPADRLRALFIVEKPEELDWVIDNMRRYGIGVDICVVGPESCALPATDAAALREQYDVVVIDEGPDFARRIGDANLRMIEEACKQGMGLLQTGGWEAYGKAGFAESPLAEASPVVMTQTGRVEGKLDVVWVMGDHPILKGLGNPGSNMPGASLFEPKDDATVLMKWAADRPVLVEGRHGHGRTMAFASGLRGGWGAELWKWPNFDLFVARTLAYLAGLPYSDVVGLTRLSEHPYEGLKDLPPVQLSAAISDDVAPIPPGGEAEVRITIRNLSKALAFCVAAEPQQFPFEVEHYSDDNFIFLEPGQSRTLTITLRAPTLSGRSFPIAFLVRGWNTNEVLLPLIVKT